MGSRYIPLNHNRDLLDLLLECTRCQWADIALDTFHMWEELVQHSKNTAPMLPQAAEASTLELCFQQLLLVLVSRTEYPTDFEMWDEDARDDFGELRSPALLHTARAHSPFGDLTRPRERTVPREIDEN